MIGIRIARERAFTIIELLVVIAIIGVLISMMLVGVEMSRNRAMRMKCANNLHQIGVAMQAYAQANHGGIPRTRYVPGAPLVEGTGAASPDPFSADGPSPNDVTAPAFLLMRTQDLPAVIFCCPYGDVNVFEPDPAEPLKHSNFTDWRKNLGYSFANPYPDPAIVGAGHPVNLKLTSDTPLAADLNPGLEYGPNSRNHEYDGQNVLYADGHVTWTTDPNVGAGKDNIYRNGKNLVEASPFSPGDTILLPAEK